MALEISGKITQILEPQSGEGKNGVWKKQSFVIEYMDGNYPKMLSIMGWGDKADMIASLRTGDQVKVAFNVESREYNGRWYTDVKAWRIEKSGETSSADQGFSNPPEFAAPDFGPGGSISNEAENDLPF